ncbi:MAG TPA: PAS domain S-box protein [Ktedonobacterales bacterium]|nr:PAS domain S-box protein [Ktedonobacterales bacterium]
MKHQTKTPIPQGAASSGPLVAEREADPLTEEQSRERLLDFLRAVTDNLGEGLYTLDAQGRVTLMNPAAERMLGWSEAELLGKDMHQTIHFQHADKTPYPREECPLLRVIQTGTVEQIEDDVFTRRDGSFLPVAYVSSRIVTRGEVAGAVLAFHDISAHKAMDEALRRSERAAASRASQLLAIFETIADAMLVYDRAGNILQTNAADNELFPWLRRPGVTPRTLDQRDRAFTYLDDAGRPLPNALWPTERVLHGETLRGDNAVDLKVRAPDGREFVVNASGAPVRDSDGSIAGGVLIGRDVTQRRRLERQTREALTAMMAMAEALVSSGATTPDGTPLSSAPEIARRLAELARAVMGCQRVGVITFNLETQLIHTIAVSGLSKEQESQWAYTARLNEPPEIVQRLQAGEMVTMDRTRPPYDSLPNPFGSRAMLLTPMSVGGPLLGVITVDYGSAAHEFSADEFALAGAVAQLAAQIIERERLGRDRETARANALALAETARRMDEFLSIAAHELKTPVTNGLLSVTLAIDTLRAYIAQAQTTPATARALEPIRALLEQTGSHVERLSRLVVDLLDVSRIRAGKLELRVAPHDLAAIVREVVEEQRRIAAGRTIRLRLPASPGRRTVALVDADRIRQVVSNYLTNALAFSRAEQPVTVTLRTDGEWARVSVRDDGPGIPAAEQRRVWERFYRVRETQAVTGAGAGLGLGLHISRTIIEQHQGRVGLRSARGKGALFWFALRVVDEASGAS